MGSVWRDRLIRLAKRLSGSPQAIIVLSAIAILLVLFVQAIRISPAFELSVAGMAIGLAIIVLFAYFVKIIRGSEKPVAESVPGGNDYRLAKLVKRFIDALWYILLIAAFLWPITTIGVGLDLFFDAEDRYVDVFLGFKIYPDALPEVGAGITGAANETIRAHSGVQVNTPNQLALYLSAAIVQVSLVIVLYGLAQMRALFASLIVGEPFTMENAVRVRKVGYALIVWHLLTPLLQYFGGRAILGDIGLNLQGVQVYPAFEFNIAGVFVGFAIIVLSGLLREAAGMHREQSLTI